MQIDKAQKNEISKNTQKDWRKGNVLDVFDNKIANLSFLDLRLLVLLIGFWYV